MGKFIASALPVNIDSNIRNKKVVTIAELEKSYQPKKVCPALNKVIKTIRNNGELHYDEIIILEDELNKRKKAFLDKNPHLKISKKRTANAQLEPNINYTQRKINNKFYWYKQFTKDGKKVIKYIKNIDSERIEISKATITFHPDFSSEKSKH